MIQRDLVTSADLAWATEDRRRHWAGVLCQDRAGVKVDLWGPDPGSQTKGVSPGDRVGLGAAHRFVSPSGVSQQGSRGQQGCPARARVSTGRSGGPGGVRVRV